MSADAHTPGPWFVDELCIESAVHGNIGLINIARRSKADARLFAAAPDLLEALRVYVAYDEYINGPDGDPSTDRLQKAKAALAKAGGK